MILARRTYQRLVAVLLVLCAAAVVNVLDARPASAAAEPTDWVPTKLSFNPKILVEIADWPQVEAQQLRQALGQRAIDDILGKNLTEAQKTARFHMQAQAAAARGAYIPGLSDAAKALGRSPQFISFEEAGEWFSKVHGTGSSYSDYPSKPGSGGVLSAKKGANGVFDITTLGKEKGLKKGAKKMGGALLKTAGTVMVAGEVLNLTYTLTNGGAQLMGVPGADASSGSITCDLASAVTFAEDIACGLGADASYQINGDVLGLRPGWVGDRTTSVTGSAGQTLTVATDVLSAPAFKATGGEMTLRANYGYSGTKSQALGISQSVQLKATNTAGSGYGSVQNLSSSSVWWPNWAQSGSEPMTEVVLTQSLAGSQAFDHIELVNGQVVIGRWYPVGHAKRPLDVAEDPERWWVTEWTCTGGGGDTKASPRYRESEETWATPVNPTCGAGQVASVKIWQHTEGLDPVVVFEWSPSPGVTNHNQTYPQCSRGECVLDLLTKKTGKLVSCFDSPSLCTDWFSEADKATDYECHYAGAKIALESCNVYSTTFNQPRVKVGQPYGDPLTGDPIPVTNPDPGTGPNPDPTGPGASADCPPTFSWGSAFNPWWYYKAASCALSEAFVPKRAAYQVNRVRDGLAQRAPFSVIAGMPVMVSSFKDGWSGSCTAMPNFSPIEGKPLRMPCAPPDSAAWRAAYRLMQICLWAGCVFGIWRMAHAAVGGTE